MKKLNWRYWFSALMIILTIATVVFYQTPVSANKLMLGQEPTQKKARTLKRVEKADSWIRYQAPDGTMVCREVTDEERAYFDDSISDRKDMKQLNHFEEVIGTSRIRPNADGGLKVILRGTAQLDSFPIAKAGFVSAVARLEAIISSPITIVIDVDFGPQRFGRPYPAGVIGSTSSQELSGGDGFYEDMRQTLVDNANNAFETSVYNALPKDTLPTNLGPAKDLEVSAPVLRALGLIDAVADPTREMANFGPPPAIGFNSAIPFDFTPDNGIDRGTFDFDATVVHEVGHALGFTSNAGIRDFVPNFPILPSIWDVFRFANDVTPQTFTTAQRLYTAGASQSELQVFSRDGNSKILLSTGGPAGSRGDRNQSSHWRIKELTPDNTKIGIMDPVGRPGDRDVIKQADIDALDIFGYRVGAAQANVAVKVTSPNGKENIAAGGDLPIAWTVNSTNTVATQSIDLSTDGGVSFPVQVALGLPGTARSFTFKVPTSLLTDNARIRVTARDSGGVMGMDDSDSDFIIATPRGDFSLAITPNTQMVSAGASTSFTVNVQGLNSFNQQVMLSASATPQATGLTTSFSSAAISPGTPSTLTIATTSATPTGTVNLTITGRAGDITRTVNASITVASTPTFMLNVNPATQSVLAGSSGVFAASLQALAGFNQPVTLTATSDQAKINNITFSQSTITPGQTSNIMIDTPLDSPALTANITITATSGQIVRTTTVKLDVLAMDYSLSFPQQPLTIKRGGSGQFVVKVDRTNGFPGMVNVTPDATTLNNLKFKLKGAATQSTTGGTVMFDFKLKKKAPLGTQKLVFVGQDSLGRVRQAELMIVIN
ncbi:MAG: hypothetical protein HY819_05320 [Acidobacteria bacterium]|nr:hypothetical protein [Acidobacteriota bacterium]